MWEAAASFPSGPDEVAPFFFCRETSLPTVLLVSLVMKIIVLSKELYFTPKQLPSGEELSPQKLYQTFFYLIKKGSSFPLLVSS